MASTNKQALASCGRRAHWAADDLGFVVRCAPIVGAVAVAWRSFTALVSYSHAATVINCATQARTRRRSFAASGGPGRSGCVWVPASASPSHFLRSRQECTGEPTYGCEWRLASRSRCMINLEVRIDAGDKDYSSPLACAANLVAALLST